MADGYFPTLVSKDNDPNLVANPIFVELSDGTNPVGMVSDALKVSVMNGSGASAVNIQDGGNAITVDGTVAATQSGTWDIGTLSTITNVVHVDDNAGSLTVDGTVAVSSVSGNVTVVATDLDIRNLNLTDDAVKVSANTSPNGPANPIYVSFTTAAITGEVHDYEDASVAGTSSDNHDYTVATAMLVKSIKCASSGAAKFELLTGPVASLVAKWTGLIPKQGGAIEVSFDPPIEVPVTSTGTVRVTRTNRESQAQSLYTTIVGIDA